jgi:hypothetical protein
LPGKLLEGLEGVHGRRRELMSSGNEGSTGRKYGKGIGIRRYFEKYVEKKGRIFKN